MKKLIIFILVVLPFIGYPQRNVIYRKMKIDTILPLHEVVYIENLKTSNMLQDSWMLQFYRDATEGFWVFIGYLFLTGIPVVLIIAIIDLTYKAWNIRKQGYPPVHCDADGDPVEIQEGYSEDDMISFATNMMDKIADMPGHEASKDDLKQWE